VALLALSAATEVIEDAAHVLRRSPCSSPKVNARANSPRLLGGSQTAAGKPAAVCCVPVGGKWSLRGRLFRLTAILDDRERRRGLLLAGKPEGSEFAVESVGQVAELQRVRRDLFHLS